jgi:hypothetical protein
LAGVCCCRSKIAVMGSQIGQGKLSIWLLQHFSCWWKKLEELYG